MRLVKWERLLLADLGRLECGSYRPIADVRSPEVRSNSVYGVRCANGKQGLFRRCVAGADPLERRVMP